MTSSTPDILTQVSKEKFRRRLLLLTRLLAFFLICAIIWIGYIQIIYSKEVNLIKNKYGSLGYCYMCGLETLRKCECQYRPDIQIRASDINYTELAETTALNNIKNCEEKSTAPLINLSGVNWSDIEINKIKMMNYSNS